MTLSSALLAGVSGLNVNASRLVTISDNIANSSTFGYKRAIADFHSMVINNVVSGGGGMYSAGGVRVTTHRDIAVHGPLITTSNSTDLALAGRGMIPVTTAASLDSTTGSRPTMFVTTGSFKPDSKGILTTAGGMVLLGWPANKDGTIPNFPRDTVQGLEPVSIGRNQFAGEPTSAIELGVNLPAVQSKAGASGNGLDLAVEYFGNLGTSESLDFKFTPTIPATGQSNEWIMDVRDSASGGASVGKYKIKFDNTRGAGGTIASVTNISGGIYDPVTGKVALTVAGGPISLNIGKTGQVGGLTQLSSSFAPAAISKNGSPVGNLTSVEVDANGYINAIYDAGFTRTIYQVPVADVPNPDGLIAKDNQTYQLSNKSGPLFLWGAGDGPAGEMIGYAREESSTDVAAELTQLIQTQRAYSSNAKIIQTVDQMLQETTNIKR